MEWDGGSTNLQNNTPTLGFLNNCKFINNPKMSDQKVTTRSGRVQWRIENFSSNRPYDVTNPFKIGIWLWYLSVERRSHGSVNLQLYPVLAQPPPLARFAIFVNINGKIINKVHEGLIRSDMDFGFRFDISSQTKFVIDVKFLELKICPYDDGDEITIWGSDEWMRCRASENTRTCLSRMLNESLLTDITINTSDGELHAHRAVLSASSPVFHSMFLHDFKEKQSSTINIDDMTSETCMALLGYMYGTLEPEDFWKHRLALAAAANKYNISDLRDVCEENLLVDIESSNVLERLQVAWLYKLDDLKGECIAYLLDCGNINDLVEDMNDFFEWADKELVAEIVQKVIAVWKPI